MFAEPFLEAIPQCHVLLTIVIASDTVLLSDEYNRGAIVEGSLFIATFVTSIFSATFGMTKLLKVLRNTLGSMANCTMGIK